MRLEDRGGPQGNGGRGRQSMQDLADSQHLQAAQGETVRWGALSQDQADVAEVFGPADSQQIAACSI